MFINDKQEADDGISSKDKVDLEVEIHSRDFDEDNRRHNEHTNAILGNEEEFDSDDQSEHQELEYYSGQYQLSDYYLIRDRNIRNIRAPNRYGYVDLIAYAFNVTDDTNSNDPYSFEETI